MELSAIRVYPLKSAAAVPVAEASVEARGLAGDRRWMVVDANGRAVTQRDVPALARLEAAPYGDGIRLGWGGETLELLPPDAGAPRIAITVWGDTLHLPVSAEGSAWIAGRLGDNLPPTLDRLRLVWQPAAASRPVAAEWSRPGDETSLSDGFPVLVATEASLATVCEEAGGGFGMERFRPNFVIAGAEPWAEDSWARIRVGAVELDLPKPCARCTMVTVDQTRGELAGEEPLAALRRTRLSGDRRVAGVLFGWNAVPRRLGTVRVGDAIKVLEYREPWPVRGPVHAGQGQETRRPPA